MINSEEDRNFLVNHRLKRAHETLAESYLLYKNNMLSAAVNRVYYSMFYAVSALSIKCRFQTGKHAQLIGWFNKNWIKTGKVDIRYSKIISQAFDKRMLSDYADIPEFSNDEVELLMKQSDEFINMIEQVISAENI